MGKRVANGLRVSQMRELLIGDPAHRYSIAAIARKLECSPESLQQPALYLASCREVKQTEFMRGRQFGYAYSHTETPDDAPVLIVKMQPVISTM